MRHSTTWRIIPALAFGLVPALAACSDDAGLAGPATASPAGGGATLEANGPPAQSGNGSGALILRFENVSFFVTEDVDDGLVVFHWQPDIFFCGGDAPLDPIDVQSVETPSQIDQFIVQIKGQKEDPGHVQVYEGSIADVNAVGICAFLATGTRVATGTVGYDQVLTNVAFTANWRGHLTTEAGGRVHYTENLKILAEPGDPNDFFTLLDDVILAGG